MFFTQGRTFGGFDELTGAVGGAVGAGKALLNNQNPWEGFMEGYKTIRNDMRHKQNDAIANYPWISKPMELLGGGLAGNEMHIANTALLSGIGYTETPNDIKNDALDNFVGNGMAKILPTQYLPYPFNLLGEEFFGRFISDKLKDRTNK